MKHLFNDEALVERFGGFKRVKWYRAVANKYGVCVFFWIDYHILDEYIIQDSLTEFNANRGACFKYYGK